MAASPSTIIQSAFGDSGASKVNTQIATLGSAPTDLTHVLAVLVTNQTTSPTVQPITPTGYTLVYESAYTGNANIALFVKQVGAAEPASLTVTLAGGALQKIRMVLYELANTDINAFIEFDQIRIGQTTNTPSVTPSRLQSLPIGFYLPAFNPTTFPVTQPTGWTLDFSDVLAQGAFFLHDAPNTDLTAIAPTWSTATTQTSRAGIVLAQPSVPSLSVPSMVFLTPTASPQTATLTGGTGALTQTNTDPTVATGSLVGSTLTVTPVDLGDCTITYTDVNGNAASVAISVYGQPMVSPNTLEFDNAALGDTLTIDWVEPGYLGTVTVVSGSTAVAIVTPGSASGSEAHQFVVSWVAPGSTSITLTDDHNAPLTVLVTVSGLPTTTTSMGATGASDVAVVVAISATGTADTSVQTTVTATGSGVSRATLTLGAEGSGALARIAQQTATGEAALALGNHITATGASAVRGTAFQTATGAASVGQSAMQSINATAVAVLLTQQDPGQELFSQFPQDPYIFSQG